MFWKVKISNQAREDLDYFRAYDKNTYKTCYELTNILATDPWKGPGKPIHANELGGDVWFRRLSLEHRMVYEIFKDLIIVASYRIHFE